jgi:hypothetical protein
VTAASLREGAIITLFYLKQVNFQEATVKTFRFIALACGLGLILLSCGGDDGDGGTTGGSGETQSTAAVDTATDEQASAANDEQAPAANDESEAPTEVQVSSSNNIWLDAWDFNCGGNWADRDGALGLKPYAGPGSCSISFPGAAGTYNLTLTAVDEFDGRSPYRVSINGATIKEGTYDLSSPLGCECPLDNWRQVCPDRSQYIGLGRHNLKPGDVIEFWGDDVYPCGEHGAYAKWLGIQADKI